MQNYLTDFIALSKFAGERFDLVQAGGGNTSVKLPNGKMLIKASGVNLSDIDLNKGYTTIDNQNLINIFQDPSIQQAQGKQTKEIIAKQYVQQATLTPAIKPSIETTLHTLLNTHVLHTHPIVVNAITCRSSWKIVLQELFNNLNPLFISYKTPGIELATELNTQLTLYKETYHTLPDIIFLQNHGLIVTADAWEDVRGLTDKVTNTLEQWLKVDFNHFRSTNKISELINKNCETNNISLVSTDSIILSTIQSNKQLLFTKPFCPDTLVYCGYKPLEITDQDGTNQILEYKNTYNDYPKVVLFKGNIYFIAPTIRKAKESEDVFKFHLLSHQNALQPIVPAQKINYLSDEEQYYLANWDAEHYRQQI